MGWYDTVKVSEPNIRGADYGAVVALNNSANDKFTKALEGIGNIFSEPERMKQAAMKDYASAVDHNTKALDSFTDRQTKSQTSDAINQYNNEVSKIKASGLPIDQQMKQIQSISLGDSNSLADFNVLNQNKTSIDNELNNRLEKEAAMKQAKEFHDDTVRMQQQQIDLAKQERDDAKNAKSLETQALVPTTKIKDDVKIEKGPDGTYHAVSETTTGNKVIDYNKLNNEQKSEIDNQNVQFGSSVEDKVKKFEENKSKIYTKEQLADEKFMSDEFHKINPNAGSQSSVGRYFSKMSPGGESSDLMLEKRKIGIKLADLKGSPLQNIFRSEDTLKNNNEEAKKLEDKLSFINKEIEGKNNTKNISFDDFKKQAENNSTELTKENNQIADDIGKSYSKVEKDISSKYGVNEVKKEVKSASEDDVKSYVYEKTYQDLKEKNKDAKDIDIQWAAAKTANLEGDKQSKYRTKIIDEGKDAKKEALKESVKIKEKLIDNKLSEIKNTQDQIDKVNLLPDDKDVEFEGVSYKKSYYLDILKNTKEKQMSERDLLLGNN